VFGSLAITLKENDQFIGYCGLQLYLCDRIPMSTPEVELFYKLGRDYWGHGYAAESCREMIRHAFSGLRLRRIVTCTHRENTHSLMLLQRLGMKIEPDPTEPDGVLATLENSLTFDRFG
jgi:RimJ/RimL family protein N-acetyltransferase